MSKNTVMSAPEFTHVCEQRMLYIEGILDKLPGSPNHPKRKKLIQKLDQWRDVAYDRYTEALPREFVHAVHSTALLEVPKTPARSWELTKI